VRRDVRRAGLAFTLALGWMATPASAAADTTDIEGLLDQSVVTGASKTAETVSDAPATVSTITSDDIQRYGIRSVSEAIAFLGMGVVARDPLSTVDLGARGVALPGDFGDHFLVVLDGHTLNEPGGGTINFDQGLGVPLDIIDHIELILGPGSVLYGGNAMLGVINIVTKTAGTYKGLHVVAEGGFSPAQSGGRLTSFAPSDLGGFSRFAIGGGATTLLLGKPLEITAQVELFSHSGPSFTWGPQTAVDSSGNPTNFGPNDPPGVWGGTSRHQYFAFVPSAYAQAVWGEVTASFRASSFAHATPEINGSNQSASDFDDPATHERDQRLSAEVKVVHRFGEQLRVSGRLYGDLYAYNGWWRTSNSDACYLPVSQGCITHEPFVTRWAGLEMQASQDWLGDDRLTTLVGVDPRFRHVGTQLETIDLETGRNVGSVSAVDTNALTYGIYAQQRWTPVAPLKLNAGARYDYDPRGQHLSPRAAASVNTWPGGTFKAIYAEAFRAPNDFETSISNGGESLRPEVVRSVEGSFEQRLGPHRLFFGVFRSWWNDMIQLVFTDPTATSQAYRNASSIDDWGFNAGVEGTSGAFHYGASLTAASSSRTSADGQTPLTVTPKVFGNARAAYDLPGGLPTIALAASFAGRALADRALDGNFPTTPVAPPVLDLRATLSGAAPFLEGLSYRVSGDYVTASQGPYVVGPTQFVAPGVANPPSAELVPINRLTVFGTLQYDFMP